MRPLFALAHASSAQLTLKAQPPRHCWPARPINLRLFEQNTGLLAVQPMMKWCTFLIHAASSNSTEAEHQRGLYLEARLTLVENYLPVCTVVPCRGMRFQTRPPGVATIAIELYVAMVRCSTYQHHPSPLCLPLPLPESLEQLAMPMQLVFGWPSWQVHWRGECVAGRRKRQGRVD